METKLLDGKTLAAEVRKAAAEAVRRENLSPGLGTVLVGDDPASELYVSIKEKACIEAGIHFMLRRLPRDASQANIEEAIDGLVARADIDGILLQLPLPAGLDTDAAIAAIPPEKDADGFTDAALVESPLIQAIGTLVKAAGVDPSGRTAAVHANSPAFQARVMKRLAAMGFADAHDDPADLAVVAIGKPGWLGRDKVKEGGIVIDVGVNRVGEKVVGDADAAALDGWLAARSPVPGGIGPLTVAFLLRNVVELARHRK